MKKLILSLLLLLIPSIGHCASSQQIVDDSGNILGVSANPVHVVFSGSGLDGTYIRQDGTSTTSALIPFSLGAFVPTDNYFKVGNTSILPEYSFGFTSSAGSLGGTRQNGASLKVFAQDSDGNVDGGSVYIYGGGTNGGDVNAGTVWIGNTTFTLPALVASTNSLYVGGSFVSNVGGFFNGSIQIGGFSAVGSGFTLSIDGQSNRTIGVGRAISGATTGAKLDISSGSALSGGTNLSPGNLTLKTNIATGTGAASIILQATGGGSSGTADQSPSTVATWAYNNVTIADAYDFVFNTSTGTKIGTGTTQKIGFWGATPTTRGAAATDLGTVLSNVGIRTAGTAYPITTSGTVNLSGTNTINGYATTAKAVSFLSYQPGLLTAVNATIGVYAKVSNASTVDNLIGSAITFSCVANPTLTMYECGTSATCASSPVTIGTVTVTAAGTATVGTVSNSAITAGDYIGWAMTAGTCASIDIAATAQIHSN